MLPDPCGRRRHFSDNGLDDNVRRFEDRIARRLAFLRKSVRENCHFCDVYPVGSRFPLSYSGLAGLDALAIQLRNTGMNDAGKRSLFDLAPQQSGSRSAGQTMRRPAAPGVQRRRECDT